VIPGGGQTSDARVKSIVDWDATVVCGTPTYIIYLGELAKKLGIDLPNSKVRMVITAGEPGAQVAATKKLIETLYGAKNYDDIGSTEISNFGFECVAQAGTHLIESMFLADGSIIKHAIAEGPSSEWTAACWEGPTTCLPLGE
jgi:phenylacetate-CoA ligase